MFLNKTLARALALVKVPAPFSCCSGIGVKLTRPLSSDIEAGGFFWGYGVMVMELFGRDLAQAKWDGSKGEFSRDLYWQMIVPMY